MAGIKFDAESLLNGLQGAPDKADDAIRMYAETGALKLQNYAKEHRPWTDRTGAARQRLKGDVLTVATGYKLRLAHGVDYGNWLELTHEKRFAIIQDTIREVGQNEILPGFENLLDRLK